MPRTRVPKVSSDFEPLLKALRKIVLEIEFDGETRVLMATESAKAFKRQELKAHQEVTKRPLLSERVPIHGRRRIDQPQLCCARWPKDHLRDVTVPAFNIILDGWADMRVSDYSVKCRASDMLLIPPDLPRSDGSLPDYVEVTPTSRCDILQFSPGLVAGFGLECSIGHSRGNKHFMGNVDERCWVKNSLIAQIYAGLCEELINSGNSKSTFYLLLLLLLQFRNEIKAGNAKVGWPFSTATPPHLPDEFINKALSYIQDHLGNHLTLEVVARQVGMSRAVFAKEFRRATGTTFTHYLIDQRMKLAETLLKKVNLPVKVAAAEVGLSTDRLRVLFHQKHGCSPDKFRDK